MHAAEDRTGMVLDKFDKAQMMVLMRMSQNDACHQSAVLLDDQIRRRAFRAPEAINDDPLVGRHSQENSLPGARAKCEEIEPVVAYGIGQTVHSADSMDFQPASTARWYQRSAGGTRGSKR